MSKISKELIENYRKIVLPFVSNRLYKNNFEGQGETDKTEFEQDFNEILNLAISALNPTGDAISRSGIKSTVVNLACNPNDMCDEQICAFNGALQMVCEAIDNAQAIPQVTVFTETADKKAVADLKAELQNVIELRPNEQIAWEQGYEAGLAQGKHDRPKGEWVKIPNMPKRSYQRMCTNCYNVSYFCGDGDYPTCPYCLADMRKGGAE